MYSNLGEYNQAKELHEKALVVCKKSFGEDHADVATNYKNLASVYFSLGEYNRAKELFEKPLRIYEKILVENDLNMEEVRCNLALLNNFFIVGRCKDRRKEARCSVLWVVLHLTTFSPLLTGRQDQLLERQTSSWDE